MGLALWTTGCRLKVSQSGTDARMNTPADFRPEDLTAQEVRLSLRYAAPLNIV